MFETRGLRVREIIIFIMHMLKMGPLPSLHRCLETAGKTPEDLAVASTPTHASTVGCDAAYLIKDSS
jgi:hypothetical protein